MAAASSSPPPAREPAREPARLVAPLIADALALGRRIERCPPPGARAAGGSAPPLFAVFADQLRASATLMGECVCAAIPGVAPGEGAPRADAHVADAPDAPDAFRRLLDGEDRMARHLRRAIATCDRRGDDWTADRLEEVLDQVVWQRRQLADLLPEASG